MDAYAITTVPLAEHHLDACAAIAATAPDPWSADALHRALQSGMHATFVACQNGQAVGFASFLVVEDSADLELIAIHPNARNQGIATKLLATALPQVKARGAGRVLLEVRQSNHPAIALYTRLGFKTLGTRPGMYASPREDGLLMALPL